MNNELEEALPKVSVCIQTYRHAAFIEQCLDSILSQQTTFPFEIILGEDESDDGTREICIRYAKLHPDKIKLFLRNRIDVIKINGKETGRYNFKENLKSSRGKYIALCEGDDYWTDPEKLQKQITFLESNLEFGICFHKVLELNSFDGSKNRFIPPIESDTIYTTADYIMNNHTATCSMVFRREMLLPLPDWFDEVPFGDLAISLLTMLRSNGKAFVFNDVMGVYNIHMGGVHGSFQKNPEQLRQAFSQHLAFTKIIAKKLFNSNDYRNFIYDKYAETYHQLENISRILKQPTKIWFNKFMKVYYRLLSNSTAK